MKKLLVLSALLGLLALPAFSADVTFGGDLTFGFITDFDAEAEDTNLTIDMKGDVDDFNSVAVSLDSFTDAFGAGLEKATVTTDVGAWLGLPVGVKLTWGYDDPDWNWFGDVSYFEKEAVSAAPSPEYWGLAALVSFGMFELEIAGNPADVSAGDLGYAMVGAAVKEPIPGLNSELYWYQNASAADAFDAGLITFGTGYTGEFGDVTAEAGVNFQFDMGAETWKYGVAVTAAISMLYVDLELTGKDTDALDRLYFYVSAAPIDLLKIFADLELGFEDADAELFQGAEFGLEFETGATWWAVGYQINNDTFENLNSPAAPAATLPDGGLFFYWDINY
jgi:hypothetical protein